MTGRSDVAAYVATISAELIVLARRNNLPTLAYLLDIARLEAETAVRQARDDAATAR